MSTKISIEELERNYLPYQDKYQIFSVQVHAKNMERAAMFIESVRAINRKHNNFIKHTCECTPSGLTIWKFVYLSSEVKKYDIKQQLYKAWDDAFFVIAGKTAKQCDEGYGMIQHGNACVCPFSMK